MSELYNLTVIPALEDSREHINMEFNTKAEAIAAKNAVADVLLFLQDTLRVMPDYSNSIIIEVKKDDGPWEEMEEEVNDE